MRARTSADPDLRPEGTPIDTLVLHVTRDPRFSAHYLVEEDGTIRTRVDERRRAGHAGASFWRGHADLDDRSVGVAFVRSHYGPIPVFQLAAACELCLDIIGRRTISAACVVGHGDVAPDRAAEADALIPWQEFAANGVGLWPEQDGAEATSVSAALARIGYRIDLPQPVLLRAFQRHWLPERVTGTVDPATRRRLEAVVAMA